MPIVAKPLSQLAELEGDPADIGAEETSNKGQSNGYAALDADGNIDPAQMSFSVVLRDSTL